jgi:hypothetical protein
MEAREQLGRSQVQRRRGIFANFLLGDIAEPEMAQLRLARPMNSMMELPGPAPTFSGGSI